MFGECIVYGQVKVLVQIVRGIWMIVVLGRSCIEVVLLLVEVKSDVVGD